MARSVNKVILIGHLGDDPELRYTDSGTAVCNMSLATDESYVDQDGNEVERTEWHDIVAWGRLAEICGEHLSKGSQVHFEGSLQTSQWEDRDGNTRYSTEVKAREMMFLDGNRPGPSAARRQQAVRAGAGPAVNRAEARLVAEVDGPARPPVRRPRMAVGAEAMGTTTRLSPTMICRFERRFSAGGVFHLPHRSAA